MRRRDFTKLALAGTVGTVAAPAVVQAQTTFNWKMTSFYGPNAAFYSTGPGSAKDLIKRIDEMSGGRIKIQFYGAGELIPAREGFDAVSAGTVEMNYANAYFWTGKTLRRAIFHRRSVRPELPGLQRLDVRRRRPQAVAARSTTASISCRFLCGNTGVQMTGWFKQADRESRRLQGPEDAHPGSRGPRLSISSASTCGCCPPGEIFPGARARRDRRGRIRRSLSRPPARPAQGGQILLHDRLARDRHGQRADHQQGEVEFACRPTSRRSSRTPAPPAMSISEAWCQKNNAEAMEDLVKNQGVIASPLPDADRRRRCATPTTRSSPKRSPRTR